MCAKDCGKCEDCRETDTWPVPAELKQPPTASVSVPETRADAEQAHGPTLTADGFTEALLAAARKRAAAHRALRRDGGEPDERLPEPTTRGDWLDEPIPVPRPEPEDVTEEPRHGGLT